MIANVRSAGPALPIGAALTLASLVLLPTASATAGDWLHKRPQGQLIAVPVAAPAAIVSAVPAPAAQVNVLHLPPQSTPLVYVPTQPAVVRGTAQVESRAEAAPAPAAIHITVIEAPERPDAPSSQAVPAAQSGVALAPPTTVPVTVYTQAIAPAYVPAVAAPQAVPVQLYYIPPAGPRPLFKKH